MWDCTTNGKSPRQMAKLARGGDKPSAATALPDVPPAVVAQRPILAGPENPEFDAAADWLAHVAAGRIAVR